MNLEKEIHLRILLLNSRFFKYKYIYHISQRTERQLYVSAFLFCLLRNYIDRTHKTFYIMDVALLEDQYILTCVHLKNADSFKYKVKRM